MVKHLARELRQLAMTEGISASIGTTRTQGRTLFVFTAGIGCGVHVVGCLVNLRIGCFPPMAILRIGKILPIVLPDGRCRSVRRLP